jgi:hypothetical protein
MSLKGEKSKTKASQIYDKKETQTTSGVQTSTQSLNPWSLEQYNAGRTGILGTLDNYNQNSPYKAYSGPLTAGLTDAERQARAIVSARAGRPAQSQSSSAGYTPGGAAANAQPQMSDRAEFNSRFARMEDGSRSQPQMSDRAAFNSRFAAMEDGSRSQSRGGGAFDEGALPSGGGGQNGLLDTATNMIMRGSNAGPNLTEAARVDGLMGYNAATVNAPNLGRANTFDAASANAAQIGQMDQIGNRLGEIDKYQNPELSRVVDTTLASYDEDAARQRARMQAQGAAAGKFGGSRFGVEQGVFGADVARNRAGVEAGLRSNAYDRATGLLGTDVGTVNQGKIAQAGMDQQASIASAGFENAARAANTAAANSRDSERAGYAFNANTFNTGAANDASRFGADVNNQGALTNAGYQQQANLTNASAREQALGRQMQGGGLLANVQGQQFGQDMQVADSLRQMGMDERQIADLQILREMAQYDKAAADQLQRVQMQLQAQFGLLGAAPMLTDSRQTTDGTMSGTQSGTGSSTSKTGSIGFDMDLAKIAGQVGKMMAGVPA